MSTWRVARSLEVLLMQIDKRAPNRSKASDGAIGDAAHASRDSDHNPWVQDNGVGIVTARDFTHDPVRGADMRKLSERLRRHRDPRIKYVIFDERMFSSYPTSGYAAFTWRPYYGPNPHGTHMHVSVLPEKEYYDSRKRWKLRRPIFYRK